MKKLYRIQVGDWTSKSIYNKYNANLMRKKLTPCFNQRVMAVKEGEVG